MPSFSSQSAVCCIAPLTDFTARLVALLHEGEDGEFIRNRSEVHGLTAANVGCSSLPAKGNDAGWVEFLRDPTLPRQGVGSRNLDPTYRATGLQSFGSRLELHRFTAAAGWVVLGVVEQERGGDFVGFLTHPGPEKKKPPLRVDDPAHPLILSPPAALIEAMGIFQGVGHPGETAVLHADAHPHHR